jgi:hypothetical protein
MIARYVGADRDELYEMDREEARELIIWYAEQGRTKAAWVDARKEIQIHYKNRPDDGAWYAACGTPYVGWPRSLADWDDYRAEQFKHGQEAHAVWVAELRELLDLRRRIPDIAAVAARRMSKRDLERRAAFNRVFNEQAEELAVRRVA